MRRRDLMLGAGAVGLASLLPRAASASAADRRFVFVLCNGGWDPTRVFLSGFDNPHVEMESDAEPWTVGDLDLVDHPDRPEVRAFFETWGDRAVVLNGMQLPAIDHFTCMKHLLTGDASGVNPDWSVRLAAAAPAMAMPSLVLSGPVFTGPHADTVVRAGLNGQLAGLVDPSDGALGEAWQPSEATAARLDAAMLDRGDALLEVAPAGALDALDAWVSSSSRAQGLIDSDLQLDAAGQLDGRFGAALDVLAAGLSAVRRALGLRRAPRDDARPDRLATPGRHGRRGGVREEAATTGPTPRRCSWGLDSTAGARSAAMASASRANSSI